MKKATISTIALLIILSITGVIIFQLNWLIKSYNLSKEDLHRDISNIFEAAIQQHKREVADSARRQMKALIRSEKDFKYEFFSFKGHWEIGFRNPDHNTILPFNISVSDTGQIKNDPYGFLMYTIDQCNLDKLYAIYSNLIGTRSYPDNSDDDRRAYKLMRTFHLHRDTTALVQILKQRFRIAKIPFNGTVYYYENLSKIYEKSIPNPQVNSKGSKRLLEMPMDGWRDPLAVKLDKLNKFISQQNQHGPTWRLAKPLLYDINDILMDNIQTLVLTITLPNSFIYSKMAFNIANSVILLLCVMLCLTFLLSTIIKQKKLAEIKHDFISNITHELKTPVATALAAVQGLQYFDVLKDPEKTSSYLDTAANEIKRLSQMINKIISVSVFESKGFQLNPSTFNFKEMLTHIISGQQIRQEKEISISLDYRAPQELFADRQHLQNVILNLIDNAVNYSGNKVQITIECIHTDDWLQISIADNGIGIAPEYQKAIFDRFSRVPGTNIRGYGLGLNYVKQIVEMHNGNIELAASGADGSVFIINLPQ